MKQLSFEEDDYILVVAPHPDDEVIGVGGTIISANCKVDVWLITDGRYGTNDGDWKKCIKTREREFECAIRLLGINRYIKYDVEDGTVSMINTQLFDKNVVRYTKIFVPNMDDKNMDHVATTVAILKAFDKYLDELEVYQYEVSSPLKNITHYVNISNCIEQKIDALSVYQSQLKQLDYIRMTRSLNAFRASVYGLEGYIEAFTKVDLKTLGKCEQNAEISNKAQKFKADFNLCLSWLQMIISGKDIIAYLFRNNYQKIAIYGYSKIGKTLVDYLENNMDCIKYIVDKNTAYETRYPLFNCIPGDIEVDLLIIVPSFFEDEIRKEIGNVEFDVKSLKSIIESMREEE